MTRDASVRFWHAMYVAALLALFAIGAWLQSQVHLNHDVGWILRSSGWLLEGRRFGSGVLDPNPPLIWFVSLPAAAVVRAGWLSEPVALRLYIWVLCALAILLCHRVMRPMRSHGQRSESIVLVLAITAACTLLPAAAYGQREFLSFVFSMPYCLLAAGRISYGAGYSSRLAVVVGMLAGVGFAFKPWLLAVPFGIEVIHFAHRRRLRECLRPETLALGATIGAYLIAVLVVASDYLTGAIPLIRAVYWAYENATLAQMLSGTDGVLEMVAISAVLLLLARRFGSYTQVLVVALLGFTFSYWVQKKGFAYHAYPMIAAAFVLLAYSVVCATRRLLANEMTAPLRISLPLFLVLLFVVYHPVSQRLSSVNKWFGSYRMDSGVQGLARQALIDRVNALAGEGDYVYAFSTHPYPAFPTLNYVRAEWASSMPCQFILPAHAKRKGITEQQRLRQVDAAVVRLRETVAAEFLRYRPRVVLVNTSFRRLGLGYSKFDDVAFYSEDPRFSDLWRHYELVRGVDGLPNIKIFVRSPEERT